MSETQSLWALLVSAFTSATILPGTSELGLLAFVYAFPHAMWAGLAVATVGNTVGGLTSYFLGRMAISVPSAQSAKENFTGKLAPKVQKAVERYGAGVLLLSWVPVIGDVLCVAAGWLRLNMWHCALAIVLGKFARYALLVFGVRAAFGG